MDGRGGLAVVGRTQAPSSEDQQTNPEPSTAMARPAAPAALAALLMLAALWHSAEVSSRIAQDSDRSA